MAEFVDQIPQQPGLAFEEKTHQYILNGMQVLPSVTTLMKPLSDTLYAGIRPETLQAAAERGTEVHSAIEDYVTLGITDISEARRGYFEAFLRWMKDYNVQPLSVEHRAYHPALGYAGTLDMIFEKAEIGQKLKALKAAVPQSRSAGAESITQGVLFEGNTMAASNGVIYAQAKIPYNIAEPFILPPNGVDLICGLDDPQVSIEKDGDNVKVAGAGKKRAKATLLTGTIDNFMRIAPPQQGMRNVSVDAEELIAAIKRVGYAVSLNPNRPAMTGIYFKAENGKLNLVGCDGSQLAKVEFPYEEDFHFILPNETAKSLAALDLHGQCQITGDHKKAVFSTEDYTLTTSLICGEYMNYESVIPKAGKYDVVFDRDSLLGAATRVKNLMDLKHREPVVLHIDGESCYITSRLTGVEFHEDVLCQGTIPEPMNIAFDDILLLNGISATKGEGIRALLNSSLSPMKIENEGFTALVLPVRMKNRA